MSGVSLASSDRSPAASALGALFASSPEGSVGAEGAAATTSFGTALALAERILAGADESTPMPEPGASVADDLPSDIGDSQTGGHGGTGESALVMSPSPPVLDLQAAAQAALPTLPVPGIESMTDASPTAGAEAASGTASAASPSASVEAVELAGPASATMPSDRAQPPMTLPPMTPPPMTPPATTPSATTPPDTTAAGSDAVAVVHAAPTSSASASAVGATSIDAEQPAGSTPPQGQIGDAVARPEHSTGTGTGVGTAQQTPQGITASISTPPIAPIRADAAPEAATVPTRGVAAQVSPAVLSIVQRPVGSHQLTMTVNPDTFGPVTVRAHISAAGDVRVELLGATDLGREALRSIVTDLRRDLTAVMPHASLSLGSGTSADAGGTDRDTPQGAANAPGGQPSGGRDSGDAAPGSRHRADGAFETFSTTTTTTTTHAVSGAGLDTFA
ncbi:MAG: hypothetical protein P0Y60_11430 [Candidatus Microbacterium colombiense]|nr:MAG: hypothetical protein P0Y60_11430 [Microbacterium sp.]